MASFAQRARAIRRDLAGDRHRPRVHFQPPRFWMNDPNGLIQFGGRYHLFYQHNPHGPRWGNMTWGHAVSDDLLHWDDLPHALHPDEPYDAGGVFSGCCVDADGTPTIAYTGHRAWGRDVQVQCIATGDADLLRWRKHEANPVIPAAPEGFSQRHFRDPCVWRQRGAWNMVVGGSDAEGRGAVLLYRSSDLVRWRFLGPLLRFRGDEGGRIFECPNFFKLGGKWVLIGSPIPLGRAVYFTGSFDGRVFTPEVRGEIDPGRGYAPQCFAADRGRRVMFCWLREGRSARACSLAGWSGVMSLPRTLSLRPDGGLDFAPADELLSLRRNHRDLGPVTLDADELLVEPELAGTCTEIAAEFVPGRAERIGLVLRRSPRGGEETLLAWDRRARSLVLDTRRSSRSAAAAGDVHTAPLDLADAEPLSLRAVVDASVIEVFANGHTCLTGRVYPAGAGSVGAGLFCEGGPAEVTRLDAWDLEPV